jgi:hypothetical protein
LSAQLSSSECRLPRLRPSLLNSWLLPVFIFLHHIF